MNNVVLIGRLTKDPELNYTPNTQTANTRFTIAVDRPKKNGQDQGADFIRIVVWGKQAETCSRYLAKGRQIAVQGRIETGSYKSKEGVTVYTTDVVAERVEFLGSGAGSQGGNPNGNYGDQQANLPPAMQPQGAPNQGNIPPAPQNNVQQGTQMGFNDMAPGEDEPW